MKQTAWSRKLLGFLPDRLPAELRAELPGDLPGRQLAGPRLQLTARLTDSHRSHGGLVKGRPSSWPAEMSSVLPISSIRKWVARGLALSVPETIRTGVFDVGPPAAP